MKRPEQVAAIGEGRRCAVTEDIRRASQQDTGTTNPTLIDTIRVIKGRLFLCKRKARIIDSESAGLAASYDNNRALVKVESTAGSSSAKKSRRHTHRNNLRLQYTLYKEKVNIFGRLTNATLGA